MVQRGSSGPCTLLGLELLLLLAKRLVGVVTALLPFPHVASRVHSSAQERRSHFTDSYRCQSRVRFMFCMNPPSLSFLCLHAGRAAQRGRDDSPDALIVDQGRI